MAACYAPTQPMTVRSSDACPRFAELLFLIIVSLGLVPFTANAQEQCGSEMKLTDPDGVNGDQFGFSAAASQRRLVVGVPGDDALGGDAGAVYVYGLERFNWIQTVLRSSTGSPGDRFGYWVGISGNRIVVGAPYDDDRGTDSGAAYVYEWNGGDWQETKLTASDGAPGDLYGSAVGISRNRVIVGAWFDDDNGLDSGSAYIYEKNGNDWVEAKITSSPGQTQELFGLRVDIDGDRAVVGAPWNHDLGDRAGAAYVFELEGDTWQHTKLTAFDGAPVDQFGRSVSISGDRVAVGARQDDDNGPDSGSVYVYELVGDSWLPTKITPTDGQAGDRFGYSVSIARNRMVVGAEWDDDQGSKAGSAYVYDWRRGTWSETKLLASDGEAGDIFGQSVSVSGRNVLVGAYWDVDHGTQSGSAYLFECPPRPTPPNFQ